MSVGFTDAKASSILQQNIKATTFVCLSSSTPKKNGGNFSEPSGTTGYSRRAFGPVNTSISAQVANNDIIFLFEALGDCGSFTHLGLSDSGSIGGTVFFTVQLESPITVTAGYVPLIRKNQLVIGLDKEALEAYAA